LLFARLLDDATARVLKIGGANVEKLTARLDKVLRDELPAVPVGDPWPGGRAVVCPQAAEVCALLAPPNGGLDISRERAQISSSSMATDRPKQDESDGDLATDQRPKVERPRRYVVVLHNDDYTTMEFVVHVLMKFFHLGETESTQIMLHVHHKGYGIVGAYTRDVAETKSAQVMDYAKEHGHPLRCTAEPEGFGES
jgi:ATP-dependent Clp protease adaptor protein ClpS